MPKARTPVDIVVDLRGAALTFRVTPQPRTRFEMGDIGVAGDAAAGASSRPVGRPTAQAWRRATWSSPSTARMWKATGHSSRSSTNTPTGP
jgi:hypothetical protein